MRLRPVEFKILQHLRDTRLFAERPGKIHLMISGGKDSIALLEILQKIASLPTSWSGVQLNLTLHHFNHKRRGEESDQDEALCTDLARRIGQPIVLHRWSDALEQSLARGRNFHDLAREWRYQSVRLFAEECANREQQHDWLIATAHHRRDHAETLIHNLVRGCGADGLQGISPWNIEQRLLRPLLWLPSDQLDDYIKSKSFPHREDSSNQTLDYTRNRLRSIVIAELEQINPKAVEHIWSVSQDLRYQYKLPAPRAANDTPAAVFEINSHGRSVDIHKLGGISELRKFLLSAEPELAGQLTREKLTNIFTHVRKLAANPSQREGYKIALSERSFVTINSKQLEIKVTS